MLIKKDEGGDEITPRKMVVNLCSIAINCKCPIKDSLFYQTLVANLFIPGRLDIV